VVPDPGGAGCCILPPVPHVRRQWEWVKAESGTEEDLNRLKKSFPTPRDAVDHIMDTFPIVKRNDESMFGSYRTKAKILEIYDEMQEAVRSGGEYVTKLEPPPGDPRCCRAQRAEKVHGA